MKIIYAILPIFGHVGASLGSLAMFQTLTGWVNYSDMGVADTPRANREIARSEWEDKHAGAIQGRWSKYGDEVHAVNLMQGQPLTYRHFPS